MKTDETKISLFKNESGEADWWASPAGHRFAKRKSSATGNNRKALKGSTLVERLNKPRTFKSPFGCQRQMWPKHEGSPLARALAIKLF